MPDGGEIRVAHDDEDVARATPQGHPGATSIRRTRIRGRGGANDPRVVGAPPFLARLA
jgi:hypothetical protein